MSSVAGIYHIFENHYNYKFLHDGPTDFYRGLEFHVIRLNSHDKVNDGGGNEESVATVTGCGDTFQGKY